MITIKTKYKDYGNGRADFGVIKYDIKGSDCIEHIALIRFLMERIKEHVDITDRQIFKALKQTTKSMFNITEEEFGNGKRSNENK